MRPELVDRLGVEVDHSGAVALRRRVDDLVADGDERLADRQPRPVQIEVAPAQAEDLAASHAGHRREPPDRLQPSPADGLEEARQLIRLPRLDPARGAAVRPGRLGCSRHVLDEQAGIDRVREDLVQRRVDVADRLGAEPLPLVGVLRQPPVEPGQHRRRELLEPLLTEHGNDVELQVLPVRVERRRLDPRLGHRQPAVPDPFGERGAARDHVRAVVHVGDELGPRRLGLPAGAEAAVPLLPPAAVVAEAEVEDDVPANGLLAVAVRADALVDMALHHAAPSHSSRAGTGTSSRRPSRRVGSSPRRAAS